MILVDTSVWIDHLHRAEARLVELLEADLVVTHEGVIAELALGSIRDRPRLLASMSHLSRSPSLRHHELLEFVEREQLWGHGLSVIDVQLLGSARLSRASLWTRDKRLLEVARRLRIGTVGLPQAD